MKLRSILLLFLILALLIIVILLLFFGYVPLPPEVLGNGGKHYLKVRTDPSGVAEIPGEGWYIQCTDVTLEAPELVVVSRGFRYIFVHWDVDCTYQGEGENPISVHMDADHKATAHYIAQYYLAMFTNYGTVTPGDGWHEAGSEVTISAFPPETIPGERYVWNGWTGTGEGSYTGSGTEASVIMNSPINETASWAHQYYLTVLSPYGTTGGSGWYNSGETAYATLDTSMIDHGNGTRRIFTSWASNASGTVHTQSDPVIMDAPKTAIAEWKTQHSLAVTAGLGGTTNPSGSEWHDAGSTVPVTAIPDTDYLLDHWELDGEDAGTANPHIVLMNTAHTLYATFIYSPPPPNYYLTVGTNPTGIVLIPGQGWYNMSEIVPLNAPLYVDVSSDTRYRFDHWTVDGISQGTNVNQIDVEMEANHTAIANYVQQYYLTINTDPEGIAVIPGQGWYDESTTVPLTAPSAEDYTFKHWDVDGVVKNGGTASISVHMDNAHIATATYEKSPPQIVGGTTAALENSVLHTWTALHILIVTAFVSAGVLSKKKQRQK
jgi:hypothetical protein